MKHLIGISGKIGSGKDTVGKIIQYLTVTHGTESKFENWDIDSIGIKQKFEIKKFAAKLKQTVALLTGCTVEDLESQEFKMKVLGKEWDYHAAATTDSEGRSVFCRLACSDDEKYPYPNVRKSQTYREMLQRVGTEAMRNQIHENVWVNALFADYKSIGTTEGWKPSYNNPDNIDCHPNAEPIYPKWIITDTRFPNEAEAIKEKNGILIRVNRNWIPQGKGLEEAMKGNLSATEHPSETALDQHEFDHVIDNDGTIEELVEKVREILIKEQILK